MKHAFPHIKLIFLSQVLAVLLISLSILVIPAAAQSPTVRPIDVQQVDTFIQEIITKNRIPGMAVALVQDGQIVFMKGYGQASQGTPVTPQTQFYLGSVTKSFTALAVMQLVEQGKLDLDAPVQRYLPWFRVADAAASQQITVRHLLNHTSGLGESADPGVIDYQPTLEEQVRRMQIAGSIAPVGSQYQYDSQNYRVLGLLVETVSGRSYADVLRGSIFAPLGMADTTADPAQAPRLAQGYGQALGLPLPRAQRFEPGALPSGYLISSAEDLAKFAIAMLDQGRYAGGTLVGPEAFAQMMAPPPGIDSEYGMGWVITRSLDGYKMVYHGGNLTNFNTFVMLLPDQNRGFVLLSNQSSIFQMLTGLQDLKVGMGNLLVGDPAPQSSSYGWIYAVLAGVIALDLGSQIYRIARLPAWLKKVSRQSRLVRWLRVLVDWVVPIGAFVGLPPFMNAALDGSASWPDAFDMVPDVTAWLWVSIALALLRGIIKLILVLRRKRPAALQPA